MASVIVRGKHTVMMSIAEKLDSKIDDRSDRLTEVMQARFADVDRRLSNGEVDLRLVKGHLIGHRSA